MSYKQFGDFFWGHPLEKRALLHPIAVFFTQQPVQVARTHANSTDASIEVQANMLPFHRNLKQLPLARSNAFTWGTQQGCPTERPTLPSPIVTFLQPLR